MTPGFVNVINTSFTDILSLLLQNTADASFSLEDDFQALRATFKLDEFESAA